MARKALLEAPLLAWDRAHGHTRKWLDSYVAAAADKTMKDGDGDGE